MYEKNARAKNKTKVKERKNEALQVPPIWRLKVWKEAEFIRHFSVRGVKAGAAKL